MNDICPRLIEVALPIREISAESVRDKSLRHGHISTLHPRSSVPQSVCIIQASISKLNTEMFYRQTQFVVEEADWGNHGEEVARGVS